jgi:hypothetical protein
MSNDDASKAEEAEPEGEHYSDRAYEIGDAMFEAITEQDSEEDIFNAILVLLYDNLREDYPNVCERIAEYYTSMVMGSLNSLFGAGKGESKP